MNPKDAARRAAHRRKQPKGGAPAQCTACGTEIRTQDCYTVDGITFERCPKCETVRKVPRRMT